MLTRDGRETVPEGLFLEWLHAHGGGPALQAMLFLGAIATGACVGALGGVLLQQAPAMTSAGWLLPATAAIGAVLGLRAGLVMWRHGLRHGFQDDPWDPDPR